MRQDKFIFKRFYQILVLFLLLPLGCVPNSNLRRTALSSIAVSPFKVITNFSGITNDQATAMTLQSDGKILVAGVSNIGGSFDFALVRHNTDGSLDSSFGTSGKVTTDIGTTSDDYVYAVAVQSDGKILVSGYSNRGGTYDFTLVRYGTTGSLDTTFGTGGKVTTDIGTSSFDSGNAITIQSDGKILVGGSTDASGNYDFAVARYDSVGVLDPTFGTGGKVNTDISAASTDEVYAITVQSDGKILVSGYANMAGGNNFAVVRYEANGTLDTTFNTTGKVTTDIGTNSSDFATAMSLQSDGKILVSGTSNSSGSFDFTIVRYAVNGSLDTTFNTTGKVTTALGTASDDQATGLKLLSDGKIILGGYSNGGGSYDFALARYNSNGSLDTTFGTSGIVKTDIGTASVDYGNAIAIQSDGNILMCGYTNSAGSNDFVLLQKTAAGL